MFLIHALFLVGFFLGGRGGGWEGKSIGKTESQGDFFKKHIQRPSAHFLNMQPLPRPVLHASCALVEEKV